MHILINCAIGRVNCKVVKAQLVDVSMNDVFTVQESTLPSKYFIQRSLLGHNNSHWGYKFVGAIYQLTFLSNVSYERVQESVFDSILHHYN